MSICQNKHAAAHILDTTVAALVESASLHAPEGPF